MKSIEIDDDLYAFIAGQTKHIGESASDILRRLLMPHSQNDTPPSAARQSSAAPAPAPAQSRPATVTKPTTSGKSSARRVTRSSIIERLDADTLTSYTKRVDLFLFILSQLHELHPEDFARVEEIKGKNRVYFATSKEALLNTGSSTNPKQIPQSQYWVVTNNNTAKKLAMLEQVLQLLGYDNTTVETVMNRFA
ncbi:replication initiation negative regulator SeqA [Salinimonas lutimaris]|uniref:replication initiation negative regulator SeqA n=1 Tax=Salinimonas lutimaris TaxID=914153 RepID=UPI0010C12B84|nr:replication initiation negative regulator SeqA [Salinimonas lutimaris]